MINRLPMQSSPRSYTGMPSRFANQLERISSSAAIWRRPSGVSVHGTRLAVSRTEVFRLGRDYEGDLFFRGIRG